MPKKAMRPPIIIRMNKIESTKTGDKKREEIKKQEIKIYIIINIGLIIYKIEIIKENRIMVIKINRIRMNIIKTNIFFDKFNKFFFIKKMIEYDKKQFNKRET